MKDGASHGEQLAHRTLHLAFPWGLAFSSPQKGLDFSQVLQKRTVTSDR